MTWRKPPRHSPRLHALISFDRFGCYEAVCKALVKRRLCRSGMRWKDTGIQVVLSLRVLVQTPSRWSQFWEKVEQYDVDSYT